MCACCKSLELADKCLSHDGTCMQSLLIGCYRESVLAGGCIDWLDYWVLKASIFLSKLGWDFWISNKGGVFSTQVDAYSGFTVTVVNLCWWTQSSGYAHCKNLFFLSCIIKIALFEVWVSQAPTHSMLTHYY